MAGSTAFSRCRRRRRRGKAKERPFLLHKSQFLIVLQLRGASVWKNYDYLIITAQNLLKARDERSKKETLRIFFAFEKNRTRWLNGFKHRH